MFSADGSTTRAPDLVNYHYPLPAPSSTLKLVSVISTVVSHSSAWRRMTHGLSIPLPASLVALIVQYIHDPGCSGRLVERSLITMPTTAVAESKALVLGSFGTMLLVALGSNLSAMDLTLLLSAGTRDSWQSYYFSTDPSAAAELSAHVTSDDTGSILAIAVTSASTAEGRAGQIVTLHRPGSLHYWSATTMQHQGAVTLEREILQAASMAINPRDQHVAISFTAFAVLEIDDCLFDFNPDGAVSGTFEPQHRSVQLCFMRSPHDVARDWLYSLTSDGVLVYEATSQHRSHIFSIGGLSRPSHHFVHSLDYTTRTSLLSLHSDVSSDELAASKAHRAAVHVALNLTDARLQAMAGDRRRRQLYLFDANSRHWLVTDAYGSVIRWWREEEAEQSGDEREDRMNRPCPL